MAMRIGVDVGGTFTDLVMIDEETGAITVGKEPTSSSAPDEAVAAVVATTVADAQIRAARYFLHGTTVGLNALLERKGACIALLATAGFRDVLEVRRGDRDDPYDLFWSPPEPLVPRRLRRPVRERMLADGTVHVPLDPTTVRDAAALFAGEGVDAVAVAFLHAYANPAHELEAERILRAAGFAGGISLSHRVSGEYREYERTTTTLVDAFVGHRMGSYLQRLEARVGGLGFAGDALITRSGGGAMTFAQAAERPFETILSGPVAGAAATAALASGLGLGMAIVADVGGTSFDTCLIADGQMPVLYQGTVIGLPLQAPWVDVRSIGAGGGSVAYVDEGGLLRVGPRSAGAAPGPACYGKGGSEPTVTDAALSLGMLPVSEIAGGVTLDRALADAALAALAPRAGLTGAAEVARGVLRIANANMANAIRGVTIEQGRDPRAATLVAFGGAGPLFGTLLADELDVRTVLIPPHAGNFSAFGLLGADLTQTASRTRVMQLGAVALSTVEKLGHVLHAELDARSAGGTMPRRAVHADMRYLGQEHSLTIDVPWCERGCTGNADGLRARFEEEYERSFGIRIDEAVEIVTVRAISVDPLPAIPAPAAVAGAAQTREGEALAWSFTSGGDVPFRVVERASIAPRGTLRGPALVVEPTTTTYVDAAWTATHGAMGALRLERDRGA